MTTPDQPNHLDRNPTEDTFGAVEDSSVDFGEPGLTPEHESGFSPDGFAARVAAAADDRVTPGNVFAAQPPTPPPAVTQPPVAPVAPETSTPPPLPPSPATFVPPVAPTQPVASTQPVTPIGHPEPAYVPDGPSAFGGIIENPILPPAPTPPKSGHRKKVAMIAGATGLALLVTGIAFASYRVGVFGAPGDQAATAVPATAFAYATLDFNPSIKAKKGVYDLSQKFPSGVGLDKATFKDDLLAKMIAQDDPEVNYAKDIKPWIGNRVAVAAVPAPGTEDGATPLLVIEVTDQSAADAFLTKMVADAAQTPATPEPHITTDEVDPAEEAPTDPYVTDPSLTTDPGQIDEPVILPATIDDADPVIPPATTDDAGLVDRDVAWAFTSHYVLISDNQEEVDAAAAATETLDDNEVYTHDVAALGGDTVAHAWVDTEALLDALPEDQFAELPPSMVKDLNGSMVAGAVATGDYIEVVGQAFGYKALTQTAPVAHTAHLPADSVAALEVTGLGQSLATAWDLYKEGDLYGIVPMVGQSGFVLPDDLLAVFGTDFAIAGQVTADTQGVKVVATTKNPDRAKELIDTYLSGQSGFPAVTETITDGYTASVDPQWASGTGLDTDPTFVKAVPDAADAHGYAFVNIGALVDWFEMEEADAQVLEAVGFSATVDDDVTKFTVRVTTK